MLNKSKVLVIAGSLVLAACGQKVGFTESPPAAQDSQNNPAVITSPVDITDNIPACEVDIPQMRLDGNVNGFEFAGSVGVVFGYNTGGGHTGVGVNANVQVSWAQMDLSMIGSDPMTATLIASADVGSNQTKTNIGAGIDFGLFSVGPSAFFQTPLATVTQKGLASGVSSIKSQMDKLAWVGRVLKHINENTILINGGDLTGVKVGDIFSINNVTHFWSGAPCNSTYYGSADDSQSADEVVQIVSVPPNQTIAVASIIKHGSVHSKMGAKVVINQLSPAPNNSPARYLKKKIQLGQIKANAFTLPGGGSFDFQSAMNSQVLDVLNQSGGFIFTVK